MPNHENVRAMRTARHRIRDTGLLGTRDEVVDQHTDAPVGGRGEAPDDRVKVIDPLEVFDDDAFYTQIVAPYLLHQLRIVPALDEDATGACDASWHIRHAEGAGCCAPSSGGRCLGRRQQHGRAVDEEPAAEREHPNSAVPILQLNQAILDADHRTAEAGGDLLNDKVAIGGNGAHLGQTALPPPPGENILTVPIVEAGETHPSDATRASGALPRRHARNRKRTAFPDRSHVSAAAGCWLGWVFAAVRCWIGRPGASGGS